MATFKERLKKGLRNSTRGTKVLGKITPGSKSKKSKTELQKESLEKTEDKKRELNPRLKRQFIRTLIS